jgi:hypothetical protein
MTVAVFETEQAAFRGFQHLNLDVAPVVQLIENKEIIPDLEVARLLTEVDHLVVSMDDELEVLAGVKEDVTINLQTALAEISMPYAVARTAHKVEKEWDPEKKKYNRAFRWLGRTAVGVAESGYNYHFSEEATKRVDVEVKEAKHTQETLQAGKVQLFLSPRMTRADASLEVAKAEHLHDEDSIRASYLVTDSKGNETYRVMESLLVRDIPLEAWVDMLEDEGNLFGKSIEVANKESALGVMETFAELELPQEVAAEGPVTLVAAVIPYIQDKTLQLSAQLQLDEFRNEQTLYKKQAEIYGAEWYDFELELAKSLKKQQSTPQITDFVRSIESLWPERVQSEFNKHSLGDSFVMNRQLAALIEKAKRNIIATKAAVKTGNENVIDQVDTSTIEAIQNSPNQYAPDNPNNQELERSIVSQNVEVSGGCSGSACGLEAVKPGSNEDARLREELGAEEGDTITKDKVRACECGEKSIVYAHNAAKVIKKCQSCGKKETKYNKPKAA